MKLRYFFSISIIFSFLFLSCDFDQQAKVAPNWIRAMYKNNPATSVVIGWHRNLGNLSDVKFYYDTVDHGQNVTAYPNELTPGHYSQYKKIRSAFVELTNLKPDTRYYFVIVNSYGVSKRYFVDTLPNNRDAKISFISGGDSRNNRTPRQAGNILVAKLRSDFVAFGGDMTDKGSSSQWARWFMDWELSTADDGRVTPIVVARGNHEKRNSILVDLFWAHTDNYFSLGIADNLLRLYTLNSEMSTGGLQRSWLESDLVTNQSSRWKFVQYHKPMRPHLRRKSEGTAEYVNWAKLFYDYKVDVVMESDSHLVKSTWPLRPTTAQGNDEGFVRDDLNGTVYLGEGTWGAPLRSVNDAKSWTRSSGSFNQFKLIHISKDTMDIRTIILDNALEVESLTDNSFIDNPFAMPENLDVWSPEEGEVISFK